MPSPARSRGSRERAQTSMPTGKETAWRLIRRWLGGRKRTQKAGGSTGGTCRLMKSPGTNRPVLELAVQNRLIRRRCLRLRRRASRPRVGRGPTNLAPGPSLERWTLVFRQCRRQRRRPPTRQPARVQAVPALHTRAQSRVRHPPASLRAQGRARRLALLLPLVPAPSAMPPQALARARVRTQSSPGQSRVRTRTQMSPLVLAAGLFLAVARPDPNPPGPNLTQSRGGRRRAPTRT
mmetsp:Transcript_21277/g.54920  ORF Transcript_21277/g.54920 Transcript_21277/m.54920 type:complete len:236 (+) Transcript_21277:538-1245(+)